MNDRGVGTFIFGALIGAALLWFFFFSGKRKGGCAGGCSGCAGATPASAASPSAKLPCGGVGVDPGTSLPENQWPRAQSIGYQARNGIARNVPMPTYAQTGTFPYVQVSTANLGGANAS